MTQSESALPPERERAVWERVRAGRTGAAPRQEPSPCPEPPGAEPIPPEKLLEWIAEACEAAALYAHLARCLPGQMRPWLAELACDKRRHARRLAAQYYLLTGRCARVQTEFTPEASPLELLRRRHRAELAASHAFLDAAAGAEQEQALLLEELGKDAARHSRMTLSLLEMAR